MTLPDATNDPLDPARLTGRQLPAWLHDLSEAAQFFVADAPLVEAVNVALAVGAPLLLTGEPGTGKTQVAYWLCRRFGLGKPLRLDVRSTTVARELLYRFDTVRFFHAANLPHAGVAAELDPKAFREFGPLWRALAAANGGRAEIVLVDEIDKATRDFPNDLLAALDEYRFACPETGEDIERPAKVPPPLVVITSNSERRLPEPFLRRCIVHHLAFDEATVREAIAKRAAASKGDADRASAAMDRFLEVRAVDGLLKRPATGELLHWIAALEAHQTPVAKIRQAPLGALPLAGALVKTVDDQALLRGD